MSGEADTSDDVAARAASDSVPFGMRMQLSMSADDYARTETDLKELVLLRNSLVHHFIDQHDLFSLEGCRKGSGHLRATAEPAFLAEAQSGPVATTSACRQHWTVTPRISISRSKLAPRRCANFRDCTVSG